MNRVSRKINKVTLFLFLVVGVWGIVLSPLLAWERMFLPEQPLIILWGILLGGICLFLDVIGFRKKELRFTVLDAVLGGMWIWLGISGSIEPLSTEIWAGWVGMPIWYILVRQLSLQIIRQFITVISIVLFLQLIYSFCKRPEVWEREISWNMICGSFRNTALWGLFVAIAIIGVLEQLIYLKLSGWKRVVLYVLFTGELWLLSMSGSRAAWLGCLIGSVVLVWRKYNKRTSYFFKWYGKVGVGLLLISLIYGLYIYRPGSANGRLLIWRISMDMVWEKPLLGWGSDGFRQHYMAFQEKYFHLHPDSGFSSCADNNFYAFNEVLRIIVENGILGMLFIGILGTIIIRIPTDSSPEIRMIKAMLSVIAVFSCFSYPLSNWQLSILLLSCLAFLSSKTSVLCLSHIFWYGKVIGVVVTGMIYGILLLPYQKAYRTWERALVKIKKEPLVGLQEMQSIKDELSRQPFFLQSYGRCLNQNGFYDQASNVLEEASQCYATYPVLIELGKSYRGMHEWRKAESCWKKAADRIPSRFLPVYLQMMMFQEKGDLCKARQLADRMINKKRKIESPELYDMLKNAWDIKSGP